MLATCAGCERPIQDRFLLNVLDRLWHAGCVQCSDCHCSLTERCFAREGKLFCREDFFRRFGTKCSGCRQAISPSDLVQKARDSVYHVKCFTCTLCHKQLSTGEQLYVLDDNQFICKEDFINRCEELNGRTAADKLTSAFSDKTVDDLSLQDGGDDDEDDDQSRDSALLPASLNPRHNRRQNGGTPRSSAGNGASLVPVLPGSNLLPVENAGAWSNVAGDGRAIKQEHVATNIGSVEERLSGIFQQQQQQQQQQQRDRDAVLPPCARVAGGVVDVKRVMTQSLVMSRDLLVASRGDRLMTSHDADDDNCSIDSNCSDDRASSSSRTSCVNNNNEDKDKENGDDSGRDTGGGGEGGSGGGGDNAGGGGGGTKRRGPRTTIKAKQLETLKSAFAATPKPTRHIREQLAQETGLNMRVIQVWFQNRRSKERRMKQLSVMGARRQFFRNPRRLRALRPGEDYPDGVDMLGHVGLGYFGAYGPGYGDYFSVHGGPPGVDPSSMGFMQATGNGLPPSGVDQVSAQLHDGMFLAAAAHHRDMSLLPSLQQHSSPDSCHPSQDGGMSFPTLPPGMSLHGRGLFGSHPGLGQQHGEIQETW